MAYTDLAPLHVCKCWSEVVGLSLHLQEHSQGTAQKETDTRFPVDIHEAFIIILKATVMKKIVGGNLLLYQTPLNQHLLIN